MASDDPDLGEPTFVRTRDAPRELVFACMTTRSTSPTSGGRCQTVTHLATV